MYFYALVICDYDAGANAAPVTADDVLEPLDILVAQADAALGGHGADGGGVMGAVDADANPARVQGEEPRAIGALNDALAIPKIMGPIMGGAHLLNAEGHLTGGHAHSCATVAGWDNCGTAPGGGRPIVTGALLVAGIFRHCDGEAIRCLLPSSFINLQLIA